MIVNGKSIRVTSEKNLENIQWNKVAVDYVIESTGFFTDRDKAALHIKGGAKKVVISAPLKDSRMFVMGVNNRDLSKREIIF